MSNRFEVVSTWKITVLPDDAQIVMQPRAEQPGGAAQQGPHFVLPLAVARQLQRELADSIRILEARSTTSDAPIERRKVQRSVANDRRKARRFEGSPSPSAGPSPGQPKTQD